jgi:uncharacterized membrane protein YphA (DoxX/SURF4 family)
MAIGLLLVRLVFGLLMAAHGSQKIFGWFGGYGLTGTGAFLSSSASVQAGSSPPRPGGPSSLVECFLPWDSGDLSDRRSSCRSCSSPW